MMLRPRSFPGRIRPGRRVHPIILFDELTRVDCSTEKDMNPTSEATKLEGPTRFLEYSGVGKLRRKKVIITGGEYV